MARLLVEQLVTELEVDGRSARAVDGVSFTLEEGERLGLVGESGCGKSLTALSLVRLLPEPPARVASGRVWLGERDLLTLSEQEMCRVRGGSLAMVFQDPMASLNPVQRVGAQIRESLALHRRAPGSEHRARAVQLLRQVGISAPETRVDAYPHELSGGMRQRVMLAIALAGEPQVLIADEPTTALDVTVQAQVLDVLTTLCRERRMGLLLITHDLGVVAESCERVAVMYAGEIVEQGRVAAVFAAPVHPYTSGLLRSRPGENLKPGEPLSAIPGMVPSVFERPEGCRFRSRCGRATERCSAVRPQLEEKRPGQWAACHHPLAPSVT